MVEPVFETGINWFDDWVGGGLPLGDYLLVGPPKVGKNCL